jgi:streptogramin lyase
MTSWHNEKREKKQSPGRKMILRKQLILGIALVMLLVSSCSLTGGQLQTDNEGASSRALPAEQPESTQRSQMTTPNIVSTKNPSPWGVALDEERGFVWVAEPGCEPQPTCATVFPSKIGKFSLADGSWIKDYPQPTQYSSPLFVAVNPSDGNVWFTQPNSDAIGEFDTDDEIFHQWKVTKGSAPYDLVFDKNGNIWFTEMISNSIGFLNTKTHKIVEIPTPTTGSQPYGITRDPKGNIWFAENGKGIAQIGTFTPTTSGKISIKEFPIDTTLQSRPHLIAAAPDGRIWFTEGFQGNVSVFDPRTETTSHFKVASACRRPPDNCTHTSGIEVDKQGNVWFSDSLNATVGTLIPSKGIVKIQPLSDPNAHPHDGLAVQSNGTVWFTEQYGSLVKGDPVQGPALVMWPKGTLK